MDKDKLRSYDLDNIIPLEENDKYDVSDEIKFCTECYFFQTESSRILYQCYLRFFDKESPKTVFVFRKTKEIVFEEEVKPLDQICNCLVGHNEDCNIAQRSLFRPKYCVDFFKKRRIV